jgi:hypothetical protein
MPADIRKTYDEPREASITGILLLNAALRVNISYFY